MPLLQEPCGVYPGKRPEAGVRGGPPWFGAIVLSDPLELVEMKGVKFVEKLGFPNIFWIRKKKLLGS